MTKQNKDKEKPLQSFESESFIFKHFKTVPSSRIKYLGRRFPCLRIKTLLKCPLFSKSWVDSSSKSARAPDFHNEKHHLMMDFARVDDCVFEGKAGVNSFARASKFMKEHAGKNYKNVLKEKGITLYFVPDTTNDKEFNYLGYLKSFKTVLMDHSKKVASYHSNYPKCKTCVMFIFDESNPYYQKDTTELHCCFLDKKFIEIIKECNFDYVVWFTHYKSVYKNGKEIKIPLAYIYDVKHFKETGKEYDQNKMAKLKEGC